MEKYKIVKADYNKEAGYAFVIISNRYGAFYGSAKANPDDKEFWSEFIGCEIAIARANINVLKYENRVLRAQIKALNTHKNVIEGLKSFNPKDYIHKKLSAQIDELNKRILSNNDKIAEMRLAANSKIFLSGKATMKKVRNIKE